MLQEYLVTEDTRSTIQAVLKASAEPQFDAFSFWREWLECGSVHEDKQEALVAFANELRHHDVAVDEGRKLWSDLPRLSNAYREQFEVHGDAEQGALFVNTSAMFARCAAASLGNPLVFAVIRFRELLEDDMADHAATQLAALRAWLCFAGELLYNAGVPHLQDSVLTRGGKAWQGERGVSKERWLFWLEQLKRFHLAPSEDVRVAAQELSALMQRMQR